MRRRDGSSEGREFIRSIGWGVRDSLNCRRSRENISIKVFYNRASLGLTFPASRREGVQSEVGVGGGGRRRGGGVLAGVRMRLNGVELYGGREERNHSDTASQSEEL